MTALQQHAIQLLQRQGYQIRHTTGAGIGLSRGNDHRVVDEHGKQIRGVGARK
jgi:hypothetical protein